MKNDNQATAMVAPAIARPSGLFRGWWIVLVCMMGLSVCQSPIAYLTMGVFIKPLSAAFDWSRAEISLALSVSTIVVAIVTPMIGRVIDRVGARRVILLSMIGFGLLMVSLSQLSGSLLQFYGIYVLIGMLGAGANYVGFMRVVSMWFSRRRGLAFGLTATGVAIGIAIWPAMAALAIAEIGWRSAYMLLGAAVLLLGLPVVFLFLKDSPQEIGLGPDGDMPHVLPDETQSASGLTVSEALRTREFFILAAAGFMMALSLNGTTVHFVPMMVDHGFNTATATTVFSVFGIGIIVSRLAVGPLLDHFFGPRLAILVMLAPFLASILLVVVPPTFFIALMCALLLSVGAGAELDILGYLTTRYIGVRSFSEVYGYVFGAFMVGTACSPYFFGLCFDTFKSYAPALLGTSAVFLVLCLMFAFMRPYPIFEALVPLQSQD